jgi:hypothetical protein
MVTIVANIACGVLGVERKTILRRILNRNNSEQFVVPQDGISGNPQNDSKMVKR